MNWNAIFGIAATILLLLPAGLIVAYGLHRHRSLAALIIWFGITAVFNLLTQQVIPASHGVVKAFEVIKSYLEVPVILMALLFFCPIRQKQRTVYLAGGAFMLYELVIAARFGLDEKTIVYVMGPGLLLILGYTFYLFVKQIRFTVHFGKNTGRTLMLASILFSYCCYGLIYYFYYFTPTPDAGDAFLLYFISISVASLLMSVGITLIRKRMRELEEVKNTRKELALFFDNV